MSGPTLDELVSFPRTGLQIALGLPNLPAGRTDARGVYDNLWGLRVLPNKRMRRAQTWMNSGFVPNTPLPNNGANMAGLFDGGGAGVVSSGGFDWGGLIGSLGSQVAGIYQTKAQNKMLKRLQRGAGGRTFMGYPVNTFAPAAAGVPAVTGGGAWAGTAGGLLGAGALSLLPELGDMLPGGLEESGTGLFGPDLFRPSATSQRQRMIDAVHPTTGERVFWRPVGRPIMFTGDAALLKRTRKMVRKMSSQAGCGFGGRPFRRRRR